MAEGKEERRGVAGAGAVRIGGEGEEDVFFFARMGVCGEVSGRPSSFLHTTCAILLTSVASMVSK